MTDRDEHSLLQAGSHPSHHECLELARTTEHERRYRSGPDGPAREQATGTGSADGPRVHILLSTYNGEAFLQTQLESLLSQTHGNWVLYWRDDGSSDATTDILADFTALVGRERCVRIEQPAGRVFPAASYLAIIRTALPQVGPDDMVGFADQDDLWLPSKLSRGVRALSTDQSQVPALYSARLRVVDSDLRRLNETHISAELCGFPASLTQNIATGCTIMLNRAATQLVARSEAPPASMHDWWCYLLISAAGGRILVDDAVVVLYRQHGGNYIGMRRTWLGRAMAALHRGPSLFMNVLRQHLNALLAQPELMTESACLTAAELRDALEGGLRRRLSALRTRGLKRQTWSETILFKLWFLIG